MPMLSAEQSQTHSGALDHGGPDVGTRRRAGGEGERDRDREAVCVQVGVGCHVLGPRRVEATRSAEQGRSQSPGLRSRRWSDPALRHPRQVAASFPGSSGPGAPDILLFLAA